MVKKNLIALILVLSLSTYVAKAEKNLLFQPLAANIFEPRIGVVFQPDTDKLRLDIGYSLDLNHFQIDSLNTLAIGANFFTYTRLRSEGRFKFPVETSDYFFGINGSGRFQLFNTEFYGRLRLSHISSHLVDGYSKDSVFFKAPFIYSREFIDLTIAKKFLFARIYLGYEFIFSTIPENVGKHIFSTGFDGEIDLAPQFRIVFGGQYKYFRDTSSKMQISSQLGILFETSESASVLLSVYKYDGNSIHGMFYKSLDNYLGIGFQLIFY